MIQAWTPADLLPLDLLHIPHLGLPEVVHYRQDHEEGVVSSASTERGGPDKGVGPAVAEGVQEGDHGQEYEVELSDHEGRQDHEPLGGAVPVVPGEGGPLWVRLKHRGQERMLHSYSYTGRLSLDSWPDLDPSFSSE